MTACLLLSDGADTPVGSDTSLAPSSVDAVHDAGVHFAVPSGPPPRGMEMPVAPLSLAAPLPGFNGALVVLMFARSGLSIAIRNASDDVQKAARRPTPSIDENGFVDAVEHDILGRS